MNVRVSTSGNKLNAGDVEQIERDLDKIARRLKDDRREVDVHVRVNESPNGGSAGYQVTLELSYGPNHLMAKATNADAGGAVREARDDLIRQINDRSHGGHSSFTKHL